MKPNKTEYDDVEQLIRELNLLDKTEATKKLTEFYSKARFKITKDEFSKYYVDGPNDGGIDFYFREDFTFFIFQAKFYTFPRNLNIKEISSEIRKIINTITNENPNQHAEDFVNELRNNLTNNKATLEIIFLTTGLVKQTIINNVQQKLNEYKKSNKWSINLDFIVIDKHVLDNVIYDIKHGYIPYTGKKTVRLDKNLFIEMNSEGTGVQCVTAIVNINDILSWFKDSEEVKRALQKNVREFLGENPVNKGIEKSYIETPEWFWYKHNGIIIFADNMSIDKDNSSLILRNPQIVNGGQTIRTVFPAYLKNRRRDNNAKVLLRVYRLPYENIETYKRSIEIISALNSQSKILPSDLRSTDPRQVRLERLFHQLGFKYWRKRSKEAKSFRYSITMRNLALRYYICKKNAPHLGVLGQIENLFSDDSKYETIFNEEEIKKELGNYHIVLRYITLWVIDQILQRIKKDLPKRDQEYFQYTKFFVLVDIYTKLWNWKQKNFEFSWRDWKNFLDSDEFESLVYEYARICFRIGRKIIPKIEEPRSFFKSKESTKKFFSKTSIRKFNILINKRYKKFKRYYYE